MANWTSFAELVDQPVGTIASEPNQYDKFVKLVWKAAQMNIPRGSRRKYIPELTGNIKEIYEEYTFKYDEDPFDQETISLGETLLSLTKPKATSTMAYPRRIHRYDP